MGSFWSSGQTVAVSATTATSASPNFLVELVTVETKTAGTAFSARLTARNSTTTDTTYTGNQSITFSGPANGPNGTVPTYPTTVTFTSGVGTALITLYKAETATLTATQGTRSGGASVTVRAAPATVLSFTSSSPDCSGGSATVLSGSFTSKVSLRDAYGNAATSASNVSISVTTPSNNPAVTGGSLTIASNTVESTGSVSIARPGTNSGTDATAAATDFTSAVCKLFKN